MELLHMKISDLLLDPHLDFLSFPKHKTRWGYLNPHPVLPCYILLRSLR